MTPNEHHEEWPPTHGPIDTTEIARTLDNAIKVASLYGYDRVNITTTRTDIGNAAHAMLDQWANAMVLPRRDPPDHYTVAGRFRSITVVLHRPRANR